MIIKGQNKLQAIVIPTTDRDIISIRTHIDNLNKYKPFLEDIYALDIVYLLDKVENKGLEDMILEKFNNTDVSKYFRSIKFKYCNLEPRNNIYVRAGQKLRNKNRPELGWKSGPNCMFFYFANNFKEYDYCLYMETDCFPVKDGWLGQLCEITSFSEHFWIKGSIYRGSGPVKPVNRFHMNGNAIYATGDNEFIDFTNNTILPFLKAELRKNPNIPYDFATNLFLNRARCGQMNYWRTAQKMIHKITYTNLIQNYGRDKDKLKVSDILKKSGDVCLLHGKFLK